MTQKAGVIPEKLCPTCERSFHYRKKWERCWEEVVYCSDRCRGSRNSVAVSATARSTRLQAVLLGPEVDLERIVKMALEDRTPFDAIKVQFDLTPNDVVQIMRRSLSGPSFRRWRQRISDHGHLKNTKTRPFDLGVFKSRMQRIDGSTKS